MVLLDVNVLIALVDRHHSHHRQVYAWFEQNHKTGWATCPITENGFIRIFGHKNYPTGPQNTEQACLLLAELTQQPGRQFWQDSLSLCDTTLMRKLPSSKSITDIYLLALAVEHRAGFVSLDQRIDTSMVKGGAEAFELIPARSR